METVKTFLVVLAVGGCVCAIVWFFCRRLLQSSWKRRAIFCILIAASTAPTGFEFWGDLVVWPAVLVLPLVLDGGKSASFGLLYGGLPIVAVAAGVFGFWSFLISCRKRDKVGLSGFEETE